MSTCNVSRGGANAGQAERMSSVIGRPSSKGDALPRNPVCDLVKHSPESFDELCKMAMTFCRLRATGKLRPIVHFVLLHVCGKSFDRLTRLGEGVFCEDMMK